MYSEIARNYGDVSRRRFAPPSSPSQTDTAKLRGHAYELHAFGPAIAIALLHEIQLNLPVFGLPSRCPPPEKSGRFTARRCSRDCENFMNFPRAARLLLLSYRFSRHMSLFINDPHGLTRISANRACLANARTREITLSVQGGGRGAVFHFSCLAVSHSSLARANRSRLDRSALALRVRHHDRALLLAMSDSLRESDVHYARGTPLRVSTKKYCRDVTIARPCRGKRAGIVINHGRRRWSRPKTLSRRSYVYLAPEKISLRGSRKKRDRSVSQVGIATYVRADRVINHLRQDTCLMRLPAKKERTIIRKRKDTYALIAYNTSLHPRTRV